MDIIQLIFRIIRDYYLLFFLVGSLLLLFGCSKRIETKWFKFEPSGKITRSLLIGVGMIFLCCSLFKILNIISNPVEAKKILVKSLGLSEFGNEWPRNNYGKEWKIFNDSKWYGKSIIWYEMVKRYQGNDNDHFMRVHFNLGNPPPNPYTYCGIYTEVTEPPYGFLDLSDYSGIEFEARYERDSPNTPVRFALQVAILGIQDYAYHEVEFTISEGDEDFFWVRAPFSNLKTPIFAGKHIEFNKSRIFRISLVIKGNGTSGILDFDNLRLF